MDLNILIDPSQEQNSVLKNIVERAFDFGFECVAINTLIQSSSLSGKNISIPEPPSVDFVAKPTRNFRILSRLTAVIEDNIHSHHLLKHPVTKKYDILAVQPVGEKVLQHVCSSLDVDIISLNLTEDLGFHLKRTYIGQAIRKGACFEISYAPCLRDQMSKRMVISNAQLLVDVARGKNILISSGALKPMEMRSVEDVINLGLLFGFQMNQSEAAVKKVANLVISHAGTRNKTGCGFVSISGMYRLPKHQGWVVKACKVPKLSEYTSKSSTLKRSFAVASENKGNGDCKKIKLEDLENEVSDDCKIIKLEDSENEVSDDCKIIKLEDE